MSNLDRIEWFKAVILPHQCALRGHIRRVAPADIDIDDLVSEALARAWGAIDWARITVGKAYLFTIARNLLIDSVRRKAIVSFDQVADFDSLRHHHYEIEDGLIARDELRRLEVIVATLPEQARRVFLLRRVHQLSMADVADQMGLSVSTVEKHLAKAVMIVARTLAQHEECNAQSATTASGEGRRTG